MQCAQCGLTTGHLQTESAADNEAGVALVRLGGC